MQRIENSEKALPRYAETSLHPCTLERIHHDLATRTTL
jgi:hypothetical protein